MEVENHITTGKVSDVIFREIREIDIQNGFLTTLDSLRKASNLDDISAKEIFEKIKLNPNHVIIIAELNNRIIGCATILIEQKFIHNGARAAHIEDVAIHKKYQNLGIGKKLINHTLNYAKNNGCYKTILYCEDDIKPFYEKLGFQQHTNALRYNH